MPVAPPVSQHGFTMVELILVIVVMGVLTAVALPRMRTSSFEEAGYRDQIGATLSYARKAAIAQRRRVRVQLAASVLTVRIANASPETAAGLLFDGSAGRPLILPGSDSAQLAPRGSVTVTGPATLTFTPQGRAEAASYIYEVRGASNRSLTVDQVSGYVY